MVASLFFLKGKFQHTRICIAKKLSLESFVQQKLLLFVVMQVLSKTSNAPLPLKSTFDKKSSLSFSHWVFHPPLPVDRSQEEWHRSIEMDKKEKTHSDR